MTDSIVTIKNVSKTFRDGDERPVAALQNITIEIQTGEFFVLLGPSGCGKSTLLRILSGLESGYQGTIQWHAGVSQQEMSFVFQQFALLPWLSVEQNIELGVLEREKSLSVRRARVDRELKRFGLERFRASHPHQLSGGMRQRVGIARALASDPKVIFMDEPFSELDSFIAQELREEALKIWQETHPTIILVTHLISEAIELGDRIAVMTPRPGKIKQVVPNPLPRPRAKRTPPFYELEDRLYRLIHP